MNREGPRGAERGRDSPRDWEGGAGERRSSHSWPAISRLSSADLG